MQAIAVRAAEQAAEAASGASTGLVVSDAGSMAVFVHQACSWDALGFVPSHRPATDAALAVQAFVASNLAGPQ